jgi:hypothetical protein
MALIIADRVREVVSLAGTGNVPLLGVAPVGFQSFVSAVGEGNTTYYAIVSGSGQWETGLGTITSGQLVRTEVYDSSTGSKVDFTAGTKEVFCTPVAAKQVVLNPDGSLTLTQLNGNASTATTLQTARLIGGVSFNGSANIDLPGVNAAGNQNTSGNAASATVLQTARLIGGVSFNGSANIDLPGVNTTGNQDTSGNAATVTNGVYTTGDQTIDGTKTFSEDIVGNVTGDAAGTESDLAASTGAAMVGADDDASGSLFTTVQEAIARVDWAAQAAPNGINALRYIPPSEWAGIIAGTSSFDCTTYLQTWLNACRESVGFLPKGKYTITGPLVVDHTKSVRIEGAVFDNNAQPASVIYNASTTGGNAIEITNSPFVGNYGNQIHFKNLTVAGNALSGDGFHVTQTPVHLEFVWMKSHGGHGYWSERCYASSFYNAVFANNKKCGFYTQRALNQVTFDHCIFNGNSEIAGWAGCYLSGASGISRNFAVTFNSCDFTSNGAALSSGNAYGLIIQYSAGVTLTGCYAEGNYSHNIYADDTASNVTVVGGYWQDSKVTISKVDGLIFENNVMYDTGTLKTQLVIDADMAAARKFTRISGTQYVGTVTKTFTGGATENNDVFYTSAPTAGTWRRGEKAWNSNFQNGGGVPGWICVTAGTPGTWIPMGQVPFVFGNQGDADATLTVGSSFTSNYWQSPLTANRTVTLSTTGAFSGARFRVTRTAGATGAFTLTVGGLKALSAGQWCDVEYTGSAWILSAFGSL